MRDGNTGHGEKYASSKGKLQILHKCDTAADVREDQPKAPTQSRYDTTRLVPESNRLWVSHRTRRLSWLRTPISRRNIAPVPIGPNHRTPMEHCCGSASVPSLPPRPPPPSNQPARHRRERTFRQNCAGEISGEFGGTRNCSRKSSFRCRSLPCSKR